MGIDESEHGEQNLNSSLTCNIHAIRSVSLRTSSFMTLFSIVLIGCYLLRGDKHKIMIEVNFWKMLKACRKFLSLSIC